MPNGIEIKPTATYVMTYEEKKVFLQTIKNLKTPSNYVGVL